MKTDIQLIKQARAGDVHAFARLYESIYQDLYRFALYTLKNPADAEDIVSETVTDAFVQIGQLKKAESFKAWIFRILTNKCRKSLKNHPLSLEELPWELKESTHENLELDSMIRQEFFRLSDVERMIISMHLFAGYKSHEISRILHMNENTVRSKESRALKKMAVNLNPEKE